MQTLVSIFEFYVEVRGFGVVYGYMLTLFVHSGGFETCVWGDYVLSTAGFFRGIGVESRDFCGFLILDGYFVQVEDVGFGGYFT